MLGFGRWSGQRTLLVELESHGRQQVEDMLDVSRTVGWFTTTFPVLLDPGETDSRGEALKAIKEQLRAVPGTGGDHYLLKYLSDDQEVVRRVRAAAPARADLQLPWPARLELRRLLAVRKSCRAGRSAAQPARSSRLRLRDRGFRHG